MNSPALWANLLEASPKGAVLMGGSVVDWAATEYYDNVIEPKDYDIFYSALNPHDGFPDNWKKVQPPVQDRIKEYMIHDLEGRMPILQIEDFDVQTNNAILRVQMIMINADDPRDFFKSFDHSLTLASFGKNGLFVHKKVFDSFEYEIVTCVNPNNKLKSLARAQKKVAKYDPEGVLNWQFQGF